MIMWHYFVGRVERSETRQIMRNHVEYHTRILPSAFYQVHSAKRIGVYLDT